MISLSASLYMLVGATDGAYTAVEKAYTATIMLAGTILTAYMVSQLSVFLSQVGESGWRRRGGRRPCGARGGVAAAAAQGAFECSDCAGERSCDARAMAA